MRPVSAPEERRLLKRAANGDAVAKKRVIEAHLREVAETALSKRRPHLRDIDAVQEANTVLVRMVEESGGRTSILSRSAKPSRDISVALARHLDDIEGTGVPCHSSCGVTADR